MDRPSFSVHVSWIMLPSSVLDTGPRIPMSNFLNSFDDTHLMTIEIFPFLLTSFSSVNQKGCILSGTRRSSLRETNTFVFTLTEKDTSRVRYGIVVNFYRAIERKSLGSRRSSERSPAPPDSVSPQPDPDAIPVRRHHRTNSLTSLCLISHHPFFTSFREFLFILKKLVDVTSQKYLIQKSPGSKPSKK